MSPSFSLLSFLPGVFRGHRRPAVSAFPEGPSVLQSQGLSKLAWRLGESFLTHTSLHLALRPQTVRVVTSQPAVKKPSQPYFACPVLGGTVAVGFIRSLFGGLDKH